jgi:hypothetical protein
MSAISPAARIPSSTQTQAGVLLSSLDEVVVEPDTGTGTRRVVVCWTVVVAAGAAGAVVVSAVVVSFEAVDSIVVAEVACAADPCAAERPPDATVPATRAPAAKTTTRPESFAAFNTDQMMTDPVRLNAPETQNCATKQARLRGDHSPMTATIPMLPGTSNRDGAEAVIKSALQI